MAQFNNRIRQIIVLIIILLIGYLIIKELYLLIPGFLGAVTLYILGREKYAHLVYVRKWKPSWTALLYILVSLVVISALMYFTIKVMLPKFNIVFSHPQELMQGLHKLSEQINATTGVDLFSEANLAKLQQGLGNFIPTFLNSTLNILGNVVMMFFVLYFMLVNGKEMEAAVTTFIPLHPESITKLAKETKNMVRANAIGIPLISLIQGLFATAGYWIFGLSEFGLWGFLTGVFAFFPLVGTMLIWLPLVIFQ